MHQTLLPKAKYDDKEEFKTKDQQLSPAEVEARIKNIFIVPSEPQLSSFSPTANTDVIPAYTRNRNSPIIFPTDEPNKESPFSVDVNECLEQGKTFCTKVRNYPKLEHMEDTLKRDFPNVELFFGEDIEVPQRIMPNINIEPFEEFLCRSREKIIYPQAAESKSSNWSYILKDAVENSTKSSKNPIDDIVYVTVNELQNQTDKLIAPQTLPIWRNYLQWMISDNNINKFNVSHLQIITSQADIQYLQTMIEYVASIPSEHLEFYIWLSAVEELILHTTSEMRLLHAEYLSVVIGTESSSPRSLYCTHGVNSLMGMAVSYALVDDNFTRHKLPNVRRMLENIRQAFNDLVRSTSWMDEPTKRETLKKSAGMQSFIGYPDWITNATALNAYYEGVTVNASTHLENMVGVLHWQMQVMLDYFNEPETFHWATFSSF
uniref:Peptidase M13 N-terminal domain-containing protein n=1 Tax=Glossina palpalis gambiensis TaxID=67801 RepID=A0A1B0B329_9MUSC